MFQSALKGNASAKAYLSLPTSCTLCLTSVSAYHGAGPVGMCRGGA